MDKANLPNHISQQFDSELENLRNRVFAMGGLVEQQVASAVSALTEGDAELAKKVITYDDKPDQLFFADFQDHE